jgi:hypothetical protein
LVARGKVWVGRYPAIARVLGVEKRCKGGGGVVRARVEESDDPDYPAGCVIEIVFDENDRAQGWLRLGPRLRAEPAD